MDENQQQQQTDPQANLPAENQEANPNESTPQDDGAAKVAEHQSENVTANGLPVTQSDDRIAPAFEDLSQQQYKRRQAGIQAAKTARANELAKQQAKDQLP
jgi:ABC-type branched-subunit amino acid transport system substrate-binding protein